LLISVCTEIYKGEKMTITKGFVNTGNTRYDNFKAGNPDSLTFPLTLYYESACPLCNAEMTNLMLRNTAGHLRFSDVSAPDFVDIPVDTTMQDLLDLIHARTADGRVLKGVEVFRLAYAAVGLGWASKAMRLPVLAPLAEWAYPLLARNRHRIPRRLVSLLFEGAVRRAAQRSANAHCNSRSCSR
jgi:predicted DCC family thiol-disulfide oxidoreductase YuxK